MKAVFDGSPTLNNLRAMEKPKAPTLVLVLRPLSALLKQTWPGNPRQHSQAKIRLSILTYGFKVPLSFDVTTERLVTGHGRLAELSLLHNEGADPPENIIPTDEGDWLIPCVQDKGFEDEEKAGGFLMMDNVTTEEAGWVKGLLAEFLKQKIEKKVVAATGFDLETAEALVAHAEASRLTETPPPQEDPTQWEDADRGLLPKERLEIYQNATIKQIVLHLDNQQYLWAHRVLEEARHEFNVDTNVEAIIRLLETYAPDQGACPERAIAANSEAA